MKKTSFDILPPELRERWQKLFFEKQQIGNVPLTQVRKIIEIYNDALNCAENAKITDHEARLKDPPVPGAEQMRRLAQILSMEIPGRAFMLLVTQFNKAGMTNYISNIDRDDMIKALEEILERFKADRITSTPEEN